MTKFQIRYLTFAILFVTFYFEDCINKQGFGTTLFVFQIILILSGGHLADRYGHEQPLIKSKLKFIGTFHCTLSLLFLFFTYHVISGGHINIYFAFPTFIIIYFIYRFFKNLGVRKDKRK